MFLRNQVCSLLGLEEYAIAGKIMSRVGELVIAHGKRLGHSRLCYSSTCLLRSSEVINHLIAVIKENIPYDVFQAATDEEQAVIIEKIAFALLKAAVAFGITALKMHDIIWTPMDVDIDTLHGKEPMDYMVFREAYHYESQLPEALFQQKANLEKELKPLLREMQFNEPLFIKAKVGAAKQTISAISGSKDLYFARLPKEIFLDTMRFFLLASLTAPPAELQDNNTNTLTYRANAKAGKN